MTWDNCENRKVFENCYAQAEKRLNPLAYWPDNYIWDYSQEAKLEQWIRIFDQVIQLREQEGKVNEHACGRDWFEWWICDRTQEISIDEDQYMLDGY